MIKGHAFTLRLAEVHNNLLRKTIFHRNGHQLGTDTDDLVADQSGNELRQLPGKL
jgi:hypothetical protein